MKTVLSIDGGGIRGLTPAMVLTQIEKQTGKPICELFDLITGTSTGGILALGLTVPHDEDKSQARFSAHDMVELYKTKGERIFNRSRWHRMSSVGGIAEEKYSHEPLEGLLMEYLGESQLSEALTRVMVTCYDLEGRDPLFLKSWQEPYGRVMARDAARATSAAPTYFEPTLVKINGQTLSLADGGLFANNPSVQALAEAQNLWPGEKFFVLSLGTGRQIRPILHTESQDWGAVQWVRPAMDVMFSGSNDVAHTTMEQFLGSAYTRFQPELVTANDEMDDVSPANILALAKDTRNMLRRNSRELSHVVKLLAAA